MLSCSPMGWSSQTDEDGSYENRHLWETKAPMRAVEDSDPDLAEVAFGMLRAVAEWHRPLYHSGSPHTIAIDSDSGVFLNARLDPVEN